MSIGVGIFLMVLGAILAFAVETDVPGINVNTLGVILLVVGLVVALYSLLFWSTLSPWGRARVNARRRMVGLEEPVEVVEERPVIEERRIVEEPPVVEERRIVEERRLDDGLP
jgi:membrane-bound ClpP family serine protease